MFYHYCAYLFTIIFIVYAPGPNVMLMIQQGLRYPLRIAYKAVPGIFLAAVCYGIVSVFGLTLLKEQAPKVFTALKYIGSIYLIYMGIKKFLDKTVVTIPDQKTCEIKPTENLLLEGFLCCLTNPKLMVLYFFVIPQFVVEEYNHTLQLIFLYFSHQLILISAMLFYGYLGNRLGKIIPKLFYYQRYIAAVVFITLGGILLLTHGSL
jgi:homoserine/homoserine lactone efflux protein